MQINVKIGIVEDRPFVMHSNSSVVCFTRSIPGQTLLVAVNATGEFQKVRTPIVLTGSTMKNIPDGSSVNIPYEIELAPYAYTIMMY